MSEHEHEFVLIEGDTVAAKCKHCTWPPDDRTVLSWDESGCAFLTREQAEALINAALGLGKENALAIDQWMAEWSYIQTAIAYPVDLGLALKAFVDAFPEMEP